MARWLLIVVALVGFAAVGAGVPTAGQQGLQVPMAQRQPAEASALTTALRALWSSDDPAAQLQAVRATHVALEVDGITDPLDVIRAIRTGVTFPAEAIPTGISHNHPWQGVDGENYPYSLYVPDDYTPDRAWPLVISLHGGVSRPDRDGGQVNMNNWGEILVGRGMIILSPTGCQGGLWWDEVGLRNMLGILARLKSQLNIDENRIFMMGFSDGASASYYYASHYTTPFAGFIPMHGHPAVMGIDGVAGQASLYNLYNKPLLATNGGRDPLYPTSSMEDFVADMRSTAEVPIDWHTFPESGHEASWLGGWVDNLYAFFASTVRDPYPETVTWETDGTALTTRCHWLEIDSLGRVAGEAEIPDINRMAGRTVMGVQIDQEYTGPGLRVTQVVEGSPAEAAGLAEGDILTAADGRDITGMEALRAILGDQEPGGAMELTYLRDGDATTVTLTFDPPQPVFPRERPMGIVRAKRRGNTILAETRGVRTFTLHLSPEMVDFSETLTVIVNGQTAFEGPLAFDLQTLLWDASEQRDRHMLFGHSLQLRVPAAE